MQRLFTVQIYDAQRDPCFSFWYFFSICICSFCLDIFRVLIFEVVFWGFRIEFLVCHVLVFPEMFFVKNDNNDSKKMPKEIALKRFAKTKYE